MDLYAESKTLTLWEHNIKENLEDLRFGNDVLDTAPKKHPCHKYLITCTLLKFKKSILYKKPC